jgi:hypothetical protein
MVMQRRLRSSSGARAFGLSLPHHVIFPPTPCLIPDAADHQQRELYTTASQLEKEGCGGEHRDSKQI